MSDVGIVVIGRNEGDRLVRCLASIDAGYDIVYVDSGSSDASVANARAAGATVVALDMTIPFTAARARNAGRARLSPQRSVIQFVDGDCVLAAGWLETGRAALAQDNRRCAVFGRLREVDPEASVYNWLCDIEWSGSPGPARYFGGNVMVRASMFDAAGGFADAMIAGEEPDLAIRMRAAGGGIERLDAPMGQHDAAIKRFGQWWRRMRRSGHAYAEIFARNPGPSGNDYGARLRSAWQWGIMPSAAATILVVISLLSGSASFVVIAGCVLLLPLLQIARLARRERRHRPLKDAVLVAVSWVFAKPAQAIGAAGYYAARSRGRTVAIIEYRKLAE